MKFQNLGASLALVIVVCLTSHSLVAQSLRIGMAEADITPPNGMPVSGYYHERLADGTRDPLKAKAVVFRDGERRGAFVVADLTGISRDLYIAVCKRASKQTGIAAEHIVVSATHSHTAPDYTKHLYEHLGAKNPDDDSYAAKLVGGIVSAIVEADKSASEVVVRAGAGQQKFPVSFNRRFVMKDGSVKTWQSLSNKNVVRAAGPIDPEIGLLQIQSKTSHKTVGVISNFALHLDTVGGTKWSGDYPFYIEQHLQKQLGPQTISVFGAGTCGDINHSDPSRTERNKTDVIGNSLAETIERALPKLTEVKTPSFDIETVTVNLPLQAVSPQALVRAKELIPAAVAGEKVDFFDLVTAYKSVILDQLHHKEPTSDVEGLISWGLSHEWASIGKTLPVEVTTMTLGDDVAIVFLPGEVFVELGLAIKQASPFHTTLIIELSNCNETLYIPTRAAYAGGSYEVTNSAVKAGSGEMLVEAALTSLRRIASK